MRHSPIKEFDNPHDLTWPQQQAVRAALKKATPEVLQNNGVVVCWYTPSGGNMARVWNEDDSTFFERFEAGLVARGWLDEKPPLVDEFSRRWARLQGFLFVGKSDVFLDSVSPQDASWFMNIVLEVNEDIDMVFMWPMDKGYRFTVERVVERTSPVSDKGLAREALEKALSDLQ